MKHQKSILYDDYVFIHRKYEKLKVRKLFKDNVAMQNGCYCFVLFVWVDALRQLSTAEVMSGRSAILSTLFLGKPPRGR